MNSIFKNYKLLTVLLIVGMAASGTSCKKKSNDNPFGSSKISTVTVTHSGSILHYRVVYDAHNNVDSIIVAGDGTSIGYNAFLAFSYFGTSFARTDQNNVTTTIYANSNGLIIKVFVADTLNMLYNGNELAALDTWIPLLVSPYHTTVRTNYTWQNGDLTRDSTGGPAFSYDYDMSKAGQPGDAWRIDEFLQYGRSYIRTKHLVTDKMYGATWIEKYFYQFDGSGRANQLLRVTSGRGVVPDDTVIYNYSYY